MKENEKNSFLTDLFLTTKGSFQTEGNLVSDGNDNQKKTQNIKHKGRTMKMLNILVDTIDYSFPIELFKIPLMIEIENYNI